MSTDDIERVVNLQNALSHVEDQLAPILSVPRDDLLQGLDKFEKAKLNVALAYTMGSLFFVLMKLKGAPTAQHDVMSDLKQVSMSLSKVKTAQACGASGMAAVPGSIAETPRVRVNTSAGQRVVAHALSGNESLLKEAVPLGGKGRTDVAISAAKDQVPSTSSQRSDGNNRDSHLKTGARKMSDSAGSNKKKKSGKSASDFM